ncbi:GNAT family N-acetyltransferase [Algoriphagus antarcticus]|uniref:RimJ/RimL family protein N-acetyltransferase n=1 Tax=Algoriphagus antarcticus TaxID=238540 RepID=A0A3E0E018_9BACT|nr:GNAT family N-acetyltransferase [Algoriphagus antarcticus]REG91561.1 RimJ/RimL family protein N-acetyltransferase [Algoriphagus antarcticus]
MSQNYEISPTPILFAGNRLAFRTWDPSDLESFSQMNADAETMQFFQHPISKKKSQALMDRMNKLFSDRGHCYFAVELLENREFLGMIGLGIKSFKASFTPCVDVGWRIRKKFWNQGYATEGAGRCLEFAKELNIKEVYSLASSKNQASIRVMQKIGMEYEFDFEHPDLLEHPKLQPCSLYKILL